MEHGIHPNCSGTGRFIPSATKVLTPLGSLKFWMAFGSDPDLTPDPGLTPDLSLSLGPEGVLEAKKVPLSFGFCRLPARSGLGSETEDEGAEQKSCTKRSAWGLGLNRVPLGTLRDAS